MYGRSSSPDCLTLWSGASRSVAEVTQTPTSPTRIVAKKCEDPVAPLSCLRGTAHMSVMFGKQSVASDRVLKGFANSSCLTSMLCAIRGGALALRGGRLAGDPLDQEHNPLLLTLHGRVETVEFGRKSDTAGCIWFCQVMSSWCKQSRYMTTRQGSSQGNSQVLYASMSRK
jgi:hypothetical protein